MMPSLLQSVKIQLKRIFSLTFMLFERAQWVNQKSYENYTQKIFCSKDITYGGP